MHEMLISNIGYNHSIVLKNISPAERKYNCFAYAFDLMHSTKYTEIAPIGVFANSEFVEFLINNEILKEIEWGKENDGDIIIYFDKGKPKHAGKIYSGRIISKWGVGHLWEHDIYDVPINYGNKCRIFTRISKDISIAAFIEYAKTKKANTVL